MLLNSCEAGDRIDEGLASVASVTREQVIALLA
jgi:hypothetical protein